MAGYAMVMIKTADRFLYRIILALALLASLTRASMDPIPSSLQQQIQCENEYDLHQSESAKFIEHKTCIFSNVEEPIDEANVETTGKSLCFNSSNLAKLLYCNPVLKELLQAGCNRRFIECACDNMQKLLSTNVNGGTWTISDLKNMLHLEYCKRPETYSLPRYKVQQQLEGVVKLTEDYIQLEACKKKRQSVENVDTAQASDKSYRDYVCVLNTKARTLNTKIYRKTDQIIFHTRCVNSNQLEEVFHCSETFRQKLTNGCQSLSSDLYYPCVCSNVHNMYETAVPDFVAQLEIMLGISHCDANSFQSASFDNRMKREENPTARYQRIYYEIDDLENQTNLLLNASDTTKIEGSLILPEKCVFNSSLLDYGSIYYQNMCLTTSNLLAAFKLYPVLMSPIEDGCHTLTGAKYVDCLCTNVNRMYSNVYIPQNEKTNLNRIINAERCDAGNLPKNHVITDLNGKISIIQGFEKQILCEMHNSNPTADDIDDKENNCSITLEDLFQVQVKFVAPNGDFIYTSRCVNLRNLSHWFKCNRMLQAMLTRNCGKEDEPDYFACLGSNVQKTYNILTTPLFVLMMDMMLHATACH